MTRRGKFDASRMRVNKKGEGYHQPSWDFLVGNGDRVERVETGVEGEQPGPTTMQIIKRRSVGIVPRAIVATMKKKKLGGSNATGG